MAAHDFKQIDTKTRILDAAETLFAQNGYKQTSIKVLARRARVNQAAVNYHFGSKNALVEKVIARRLSLINDLRMEKLREVEEAALRQGGKPAVRDLLRAFIEPVFSGTQTMETGKCLLLIEGRAFADPDEAIRNTFIRHFTPVFTRFSELMAEALPGLPEGVRQWRLHFVVGALAHALRVCGSQPPMPGIFPPAHHAEQVVNLLVTFLVGGMNAPSLLENQPAHTTAARLP